MASSNEIVLIYYDCVLRASDVALLQGPHWLNDAIIRFYFEYLDKKFNTKDGKKELLFVSPDLTQLLMRTDPSQCNIFLDPLNITESKYIFFPLENCDKMDGAGGSHWSLLVYWRQGKAFYHFDSSEYYNKNMAYEFFRDKLSCIIDVDKPKKRIALVDGPRQFYDNECGIFLLCFTDLIIEHVMKNGNLSTYDFTRGMESLFSKRKELLKLINDLKRKSS